MSYQPNVTLISQLLPNSTRTYKTHYRDCLHCQSHRYNCCFNPRPFLNSLDALILDVNAMALKSRRKTNLEPIKLGTSVTNSEHSPNSVANTTSSRNAKKMLSSISRRTINSFSSAAKRRSATSMDSFLFSLVPSKL